MNCDIYHRAFIFHMLIDLSEDMTPIILLLSSLDQKSRSHGHFVEKSFPLIILRTVFHSGFIFHMFIGVISRTVFSQNFHISHADWSCRGYAPY